MADGVKVPRFVIEFANYLWRMIDGSCASPDEKTEKQRQINKVVRCCEYGLISNIEAMSELMKLV